MRSAATREPENAFTTALPVVEGTRFSLYQRVVHLSFRGPIGKSETDVRALHLATVFGLIPRLGQRLQALLMV
jgi:hypothetical protein